jgi:hypothetical protein
MKKNPADPKGSSVLPWRHRFVLAFLLAAIISACGGGSGGGPVAPDQVGFGSATLSWMPPTQNADGSALTDLSGYKIYYGNESGYYPMSIQIDNPGIARYVVENLTPNTYFFVLTAINSSGTESEFSNEASKQVL